MPQATTHTPAAAPKWYEIKAQASAEAGDGAAADIYIYGNIGDRWDENSVTAASLVRDLQMVPGGRLTVRINSFGGSVPDALAIYNALKRHPARVEVKVDGVALSSASHIAMAGEKIYSEPRTLTGSIGVFGLIWNAKDLATRNGIHSDIVSTNDNAQIYSPLSGAAPGTLNMMQRSVEQTYNRFVGFVMQNRKKTFEEIDAIGGGRVWSGTRAKELGLVDELGGLDAAHHRHQAGKRAPRFRLRGARTPDHGACGAIQEFPCRVSPS